MIHPRQRFDGALNFGEIRGHEPGVGVRRHGFLDLTGRDALKAAIDRNDPHRAVKRPGQRAQRTGEQQQQRAVEALPWVDRARIARRWPNSLRVTVTEQTAAARWGDSGLLNTRGELFVRAASHVPAELPHLSGPEGTESQVAQRYLSAQGRMLEAGMRIAALRLDERGAWEIDLDSGVTVRLGRRDVDERIERFIHTASQVIAHRLTEISYVDMRYSNGFAIGWRNPSAPASTPAKHSDDTDA